MNILEKLEEIGAIFTDKHFVYASGMHGSGYINMDIMFPNIELMSELCKDLSTPFDGQFDVIAAPATGGIVLSVLSALSAQCPGVWADKTGDGGFVFERAGFADAITGKRVLVVEDLLTTGGSVEKVCRAVEQEGGVVIGVSVVCNRGNVTKDTLKVPRLESLANVSFEAQDSGSCSLCAERIPIVANMGHGDDYQKDHPEYDGGYITL